MTADAKVGLLLGLFFIVVIAFLVNGLPNFIQEENPSTPGAAITTPTGPDMPLDNRLTEAVRRLYPPESKSQTNKRTPVSVVPDIAPATPPQPAPSAVVLPSQTPVVEQVVAEDFKPRTHIIKRGENLAEIAKKYYGTDQGNRLVVIQKLYEANKGVLKSPDRVCAGETLVIPPLEELLQKNQLTRAPDSSRTLLDKFPKLLERVGWANAKSVSEYVVREGDSLWAIAKSKLGDGKRYEEILRLNKDTIKSPDDVTVGTRLKLPPQ